MTFLDLKKAYDAVDCEQCLTILEGYGMKLHLLAMICFFWDNMVCCGVANGCEFE